MSFENSPFGQCGLISTSVNIQYVSIQNSAFSRRTQITEIVIFFGIECKLR